MTTLDLFLQQAAASRPDVEALVDAPQGGQSRPSLTLAVSADDCCRKYVIEHGC